MRRWILYFFLLIPFVCGNVSAEFALQQIVTDFDSAPVSITHAGDGSGRLFVVLQGKKPAGFIRDAKIMVIDRDQLLSNPFLDVSSDVLCCGEQGLLGLAFHPNYKTNGFFYVFYVNINGNLEVARYTASPPNSNVANPASRMVLITIPHTEASNHNGGQLQFGPDGYLYISTGDGGSGENSQSLGSLLGKILRIDVNGGTPYRIPADNPFRNDGNASTLAEIWSYGFRNPWRFSFDRATGDLYVGDVGHECREEIDFQPQSSGGGENYGWHILEGNACFGGLNCNASGCDSSPFSNAILTYAHSDLETSCASVTGGYRYRGSKITQLFGKYLYGDYCSGQIWAAEETVSGWSTAQVFDTTLKISSFGEDESGEIFVADASDRAIYKIIGPRGGPFADDFEDNQMNWMIKKGTWNESGGALSNDSSTKAEAFAPYAGCDFCSLEVNFRANTSGAKISILGWVEDDRNYVELKMMEAKDKWSLKHIANGSVVANAAGKHPGLSIDTDYTVRISFDGAQFRVFLDGNSIPLIIMPTNHSALGNVSFRVKGSRSISARASFAYIVVQ